MLSSMASDLVTQPDQAPGQEAEDDQQEKHEEIHGTHSDFRAGRRCSERHQEGVGNCGREYQEGIKIRRVPTRPCWINFSARPEEPMPETLIPVPLTQLSEEEELFRATVREFAETEIKPHVHEMDEAAKFKPELIQKFFDLGLMGIEVPEQYGGAGGTIFLAT